MEARNTLISPSRSHLPGDDARFSPVKDLFQENPCHLQRSSKMATLTDLFQIKLEGIAELINNTTFPGNQAPWKESSCSSWKRISHVLITTLANFAHITATAKIVNIYAHTHPAGDEWLSTFSYQFLGISLSASLFQMAVPI